MTTVVSRTIRSIPHRSASDTWAKIVDLIAPKAGAARTELQSVAGTACSLISEETMADNPIVIYGSGPRVRIYCLFNDAAIEGDKASEGELAFAATDGDWKMSIPSPSTDLDWSRGALKAKSSRITVRDEKDKVEVDETSNEKSLSSLSVDKEDFLRL